MEHIKGIIQIIHGMSEHKDRYKHLFKYFSERGYLVVLKEHLHHGHNNIDQKKIGIFENDFNQLIIDQVNYTKELKKLYPETPIYILGHSMGSFIAQEHLKLCYNIVDGYIICGSCYKTPFLWKLAEYLSFFMKCSLILPSPPLLQNLI